MSIRGDYLTLSQVSKIYEVTSETVKGWIVSGLLPGEKVGMTVYIEKAKLPKCGHCGHYVLPNESEIPPIPPAE